MREISAGIIAYRITADGPRFLILYHGHNYWNFPKGKIESEEKSFQTAVREVREETGLTRNDLRFNESFKTSENFTFWRNKEKVYKTIVFYLAETTQQRIKLPEQTDAEGEKHEGYGWFTYKEALKVLTKEDSQQVLKQAYNFLRNLELRKRGPVRKPQQGMVKEKEGEMQIQNQRPNSTPRKNGGYQQQGVRKSLPLRAAPGSNGQAPRQQGMPNRPYVRPQQGGIPKTHDIGRSSSEAPREGGQRPAPIRREQGNNYR